MKGKVWQVNKILLQQETPLVILIFQYLCAFSFDITVTIVRVLLCKV